MHTVTKEASWADRGERQESRHKFFWLSTEGSLPVSWVRTKAEIDAQGWCYTPKTWAIIFLSSKSKDKTTKLAILVIVSEILPSFHQHSFQMATCYKRIAISQVMCIVNKHNGNLDYLWGRGENSESYMCKASILPPSYKPSKELFFNGVLSTTALTQYWTQSMQYTSQIVHYLHDTDTGNKFPTKWTCVCVKQHQ